MIMYRGIASLLPRRLVAPHVVVALWVDRSAVGNSSEFVNQLGRGDARRTADAHA
jgi:hypothetical protein